MFTIEQILQAHSKVKSGADFPKYFQDVKGLGVTNYETYVSDGHTDYFGVNDYKVSSPAKYESLDVQKTSNALQFKADLKSHQLGKTNYQTFCIDCAKSGIEKWEVRMDNLTCTYFDKIGNEILVEKIPQ